MKCHIRVRYPYYVEPDAPGQVTGPEASQDIRQRPSALPIPIRSGPQGNKARGKTPKGKTPRAAAKAAAKADANPPAGLPAKAGKPANDEPVFFPSEEEKGDADKEQKDVPPDDPDALEKVFTLARQSLGDRSNITAQLKTKWEAAIHARDNPKVKKEPSAERQLSFAKRQYSKADAAVTEADNRVKQLKLEMEAQQELLNQKAIAVAEAQKQKVEAEAAKVAAAKDVEEKRLNYIARTPVDGMALMRDVLAAMGVTDPSNSEPEVQAHVRLIQDCLTKIGAARTPPPAQPARAPEQPEQEPQQLVVQPHESAEEQQQGYPAPPPHKKGKGAEGTPCAKPPKEDNGEEQRHRKKPDTDSQMALPDVPGDATPAPSCS